MTNTIYLSSDVIHMLLKGKIRPQFDEKWFFIRNVNYTGCSIDLTRSLVLRDAEASLSNRCHSCDMGSHTKQCKIGLIHSSAQSSTTFID